MMLKTVSKIINDHKLDLINQGVRRLAIFGSVARDEETKKSDIDILIDFDSKKGLFAFVGIKTYLEGILQCEVDLVTKRALHPALKSKILQEAKHVF
jgi:predicted nucleotidyltransferase